MKTRTLVTAMMVALIIAGPAIAGEGDRESHGGSHGGMRGQGMSMHGMPDPEQMVAHISRWLELDDAQTKELKNVALVAQPQMLALRERARTNREAIAALDGQASDYGTQIEALAIENGQIATEMTMLVSQLRVDIHSKLTDEQRQKLTEGGDQMRQRWNRKRRAPDTTAE